MEYSKINIVVLLFVLFALANSSTGSVAPPTDSKMVDVWLHRNTAKAEWFYRLWVESGDQSLVDSALDIYRRCIEHDPKNREFWKKLGWISLQSGDFLQARKALEQALTLNPEETGLRILIGRALALNGEYVSAVEQFQEVLSRDSVNQWALWELGQTYNIWGNNSAAVEVYSRILEMNNSSNSARIERAKAYAADGKLTEAAEDFRYALELDPCDIDALLGQAYVSRQQGHYRLARDQYAAILDFDPGNEAALYGFGEADAIVSPRLFADYSAANDLYDFSYRRFSQVLSWRVLDHTEIEMRYSKWNFRQHDLPHIQHHDYLLQGKRDLSRNITLEAHIEHTVLDGGLDRSGYGGALNFGYNTKKLHLYYYDHPVYNSFVTIRDGLDIRQWGCFATLSPFPDWSIAMDFSHSDYSDNNDEVRRRLRFMYRGDLLIGITFELEYQYYDFGKQVAAYWSPPSNEQFLLEENFRIDWWGDMFLLDIAATQSLQTPAERSGLGFQFQLSSRPVKDLEISLRGARHATEQPPRREGRILNARITILL